MRNLNVDYREMALKARSLGLSQAMYGGSELRTVRAIQAARGEEPCFRSDARLLCRNQACEWRAKCLRLVAEWKR